MKVTLLQQLICELYILTSVAGAALDKDLVARSTVPGRNFSKMLGLWRGPRRVKCITLVRDATGKDDVGSTPLFIQPCHTHGYPVVHAAQTEDRLAPARRLMHLEIIPEDPSRAIGHVIYTTCWDCPLHTVNIGDSPFR